MFAPSCRPRAEPVEQTLAAAKPGQHQPAEDGRQRPAAEQVHEQRDTGDVELGGPRPMLPSHSARISTRPATWFSTSIHLKNPSARPDHSRTASRPRHGRNVVGAGRPAEHGHEYAAQYQQKTEDPDRCRPDARRNCYRHRDPRLPALMRLMPARWLTPTPNEGGYANSATAAGPSFTLSAREHPDPGRNTCGPAYALPATYFRHRRIDPRRSRTR